MVNGCLKLAECSTFGVNLNFKFVTVASLSF